MDKVNIVCSINLFIFLWVTSLFIVEKFIDVDMAKHKTGKLSLPTKKQVLMALLITTGVFVIISIFALITR